jgi:NAD(P)-dependent dehydrogenase (short-subunit alcohol dehydrogenase family)
MFNSHVVSAVSLVRHLVNSRLFGANGASIVLMSSVAALRGGSGAAAYSAAKGAIISMGRALAVELASRRIRVNVVIPGVVRTPMANALFESMTPEQRMELEKNHLLGIAEPEDLAGPIAFLLSDDARCITGTSLVVDSGLTAH